MEKNCKGGRVVDDVYTQYVSNIVTVTLSRCKHRYCEFRINYRFTEMQNMSIFTKILSLKQK